MTVNSIQAHGRQLRSKGPAGSARELPTIRRGCARNGGVSKAKIERTPAVKVAETVRTQLAANLTTPPSPARVSLNSDPAPTPKPLEERSVAVHIAEVPKATPTPPAKTSSPSTWSRISGFVSQYKVPFAFVTGFGTGFAAGLAFRTYMPIAAAPVVDIAAHTALEQCQTSLRTCVEANRQMAIDFASDQADFCAQTAGYVKDRLTTCLP